MERGRQNWNGSVSTNAPPNYNFHLTRGIYDSPHGTIDSTLTSPSVARKKPSRKSASHQVPHHKAGRVKVGVRCRPAFEEEIRSSRKTFAPIIETSYDGDPNSLGKVTLVLNSNKQREFHYDYVFGATSTQDFVYETVALPVVNDVLRGFNGTIFAYGQTGTGKTYTMGILEAVSDEHAGIIPRAMSQIFDVCDASTAEITISLSFLQIYRESIQDLLSPEMEDNLAIREDPSRGFYVEGLQEFVVRSYEEAEALVNFGLENRAIAPTLMNATSSRSHTVLTLQIEQRGGGEDARRPSLTHTRTLRSKLLLVDLAGSERVRKTISKGARLDEARSINTSLSALGNVIAALADGTGHVPYRDSKLTRILNDSLGGTASTALIATVGPAPVNYAETLSTLQFASRCMAVKSTPVQHEELDYAELCARLQQQLSVLEGDMTRRMTEQQLRYEAIINELRSQENAHIAPPLPPTSNDDTSLNKVLSFFDNLSDKGSRGKEARGHWLMQASSAPQVTVLMSYCYQTLVSMHRSSVMLLTAVQARAEETQAELDQQFQESEAVDLLRLQESRAMAAQDPIRNTSLFGNLGPHLAPLSQLEALTRVENTYSSQHADSIHVEEVTVRDDVSSYNSAEEVIGVLDDLQRATTSNLQQAELLLSRKDDCYKALKVELMSQMLERRKREEEYLLSTISGLRQSQHREASLHSRVPAVDATPLTPVERVVQRRQSVLRDSDPRRQGNQAGKLGPRLQNPTKQMTHNEVAFQEVDQIGPPEDDVSALGSESGSYRSSANSSIQKPHSFAKSIVKQLGVDKQEEAAAMEVIERVSNITAEQLAHMDEVTRNQILHIREELGLGSIMPTKVKNMRKNDGMNGTKAATNTPTYKQSGSMSQRRYENNGNASSRRQTSRDDDDTYSQLDEVSLL